jgi:cation:H+ antiporter
MLLYSLFILGGVALLFAGAELLVRGSSRLALRLGLSPLVVGLTVVAFGTSAPELVVSIEAALAGKGGIAAGNVVGSNIANVGLILAIGAMVRPLRVDPQLLRADIPLTIGATLLVSGLLLDGTLARWQGAILVALLALYVTLSLRDARRKAPLDHEMVPPQLPGSVPRDLAVMLAGLFLLAVGARGLVSGGSGIAEILGVPPAIVGLSVIAIGTSLPELATSVVAAVRGEGDLALGNVVGSNLFNLLGILGVAAVVRPLAAPGLAALDLGVMLGAVLLLFPLATTRRTLGRAEGALLLVLFLAYMVSLAFR